MKKMIFTVALAIASLNAAHAQSESNGHVGTPRFFIGTGLTSGGDKLITVDLNDGYERDINAGGLFQFAAGVDYRITEQFALQASYGYHFDTDTASDGDFKYSRSPVELMGYYQFAKNWRIGAGARYVGDAKVKTMGRTFKFDNTTGAVIEGEYLLGNHFGFKLRYVSEKYALKTPTRIEKYDGSHVGALVNYYF